MVYTWPEQYLDYKIYIMIDNLKNFFKILAVFPQNTCIIVKERWWTGGIYLAGAGLIVPQQSTVKNGDSTECHSQPPLSIYVLLL